MSYVRSKQICVSRRILYSAHMSTAAAERLPGSVPSPATVPSQGPGQYSAQARPGRPAGLRERKKLATRQALGAAAMRLAVERGLENVFVEDIAAAAEVSPRTFNNYFASKYEAICALALDRSFQIGEALRERPASESLWGLMGDWKNGMWANVIAGTTSVVMIALTAMMVWNSLHGG